MRHPTLPTSHKPPQLRHSENKAPDVVNGDCAAHPNRRLYLNLLAPAEDQEQELFYGFFFLTENEAAKRDEHTHWFKIADIVRVRAADEVSDYLIVLAGKPFELLLAWRFSQA